MNNGTRLFSYGEKYFYEFPEPEEVLAFSPNVMAWVKEAATQEYYILTTECPVWTQISAFLSIIGKENSLLREKEEDIYRAQCDIETLKKEKLILRKERDAAIADLTELCMFYKTQTICNFCAYDSDEECKGRGGDNGYMNKCFKWRGPT